MGYILKTYSGETVELSDEEGELVKALIKSDMQDIFLPEKDIFIRKSSIASITPSNSQYVTVDYKDRNKLPAQHAPTNQASLLNANQESLWKNYMDYWRIWKDSGKEEIVDNYGLGAMSNIERQFLLGTGTIKQTDDGDVVARDKYYLSWEERGQVKYEKAPPGMDMQAIKDYAVQGMKKIITVPESYTAWVEIKRLVSERNVRNQTPEDKARINMKLDNLRNEMKQKMFGKDALPYGQN